MTSNINEIIENSPEWIRKLPSERKGELSGTLYDADVAHLPKNLREEVLQVANLAEHLNEAISSDMKEEKRAESREVLKKIVPILQDHLSLIETGHGENPKALTSIEKIRDLLTRSTVSTTKSGGLAENQNVQGGRKRQFIEPSFSSPDAEQGMKNLSNKTASELTKSYKIFKDNNSENIQHMCSSDEKKFTAVEEGFQKLMEKALSSCDAAEVPIIKTILDSEWRKLKIDSAEKFFANPQTGTLRSLSPKLRADKDIVFIAVAKNGLALCDADESLKNDQVLVLKAIGNNYEAFFYADDSLKKDKDFVLKAIGIHPEAFFYADESLKKDGDFVMKAIENYPEAFFYADESLRKDGDFVLKAIEIHPVAFLEADESLRKDRYFVMKAIITNCKALFYADETLKKNSDFVLLAINYKVGTFLYADDILKKDRDFVLSAIGVNFKAFSYADESLRNDPAIVLKAVACNGLVLQFVDESLRNDPAIVLEAVTQNGLALQFVDESLRNDPAIVLEAVTQNGLALQFVDESLRNDPAIVLEAVTQNGLALQFVDESLRNDPAIVLEAVTQNGLALQFVDESLRNDPAIVLEAVTQNGLALQFVDESLRNDPAIVLEAVTQNGLALQFVDESLRNDPAIVLEAVTQNGLALQFVDKSLRNDPAIALKAVEQNVQALEFADNRLKKDKDFVLKAIKINPKAFLYADESLKKDGDFVLSAIEVNLEAFSYADESLKKDKDFVLKAVARNGLVLQFADDIFKKDRDVITKAIAQNRLALQFAVSSDKSEIVRLYLSGKLKTSDLLSSPYFPWGSLSSIQENKLLRPLIQAAVEKSPWILPLLNEEIMDDEAIVLSAVVKDGNLLKYVSERLRNNKSVVLAALQQNINASKYAFPEALQDPEISSFLQAQPPSPPEEAGIHHFTLSHFPFPIGPEGKNKMSFTTNLSNAHFLVTINSIKTQILLKNQDDGSEYYIFLASDGTVASVTKDGVEIDPKETRVIEELSKKLMLCKTIESIRQKHLEETPREEIKDLAKFRKEDIVTLVATLTPSPQDLEKLPIRDIPNSPPDGTNYTTSMYGIGKDFLIGIWDEKHNNLFEIRVNEEGTVLDQYMDGQPIDDLGEQVKKDFSEVFDRVLKSSSNYKYVDYLIFVKTIMRSPKQLPFYHLEQIEQNLKTASQKDIYPQFHISYNLDNLKGVIGSDAGGLSRQFLDDLFQGIAEKTDFRGNVNPYSLFTPLQLPGNEATYQQIGEIFMWCHLSSQFLDKTLPIALTGPCDKSLVIGQHFSPGLFAAALSLSDTQLDEHPLSETAKSTMKQRLLEAAASEPGTVWNTIKNVKELKNFIENFTESNESIITLNDIINYTSCDLETAELIPGTINDSKSVLTILKKKPNERTDSDNELLKTLIGQVDSFVKQGGLDQLIDDQLSVKKIDFEAIRQIALGMREYCLMNENRPQWDEIQKIPPLNFSTSVQGTIDREKIARTMEYDEKDPWLSERAKFLQEWLLDPTTTDDDVRGFLKWVTGATSISEKRLKITRAEGVRAAIPAVHTCGNMLDICKTPAKGTIDDKAPSYDTKEGFLYYIQLGMKSSLSFEQA